MKAPHPMIEGLQREHAGLQIRIEAVRAAIKSEKDQARLVAAIEEFAQQTEDHFRREETGDCFPQAAARAPWLADRTAALLAEHPRLREQVREIVRLAPHPASRVKMAQQFEAFVESWLAHETAENELLLDAYNQDIGQPFARRQ
jgi:hemerythrin